MDPRSPGPLRQGSRARGFQALAWKVKEPEASSKVIPRRPSQQDMGTLQHVVVQQVVAVDLPQDPDCSGCPRARDVSPPASVHHEAAQLETTRIRISTFSTFGLFHFPFSGHFSIFMTFRDLFRLFGTFRLFVFLVTFRLFVQLQMSKGRTLERKAAACAPDGKQAAVALERRTPLPHRRRQAAGGLWHALVWALEMSSPSSSSSVLRMAPLLVHRVKI